MTPAMFMMLILFVFALVTTGIGIWMAKNSLTYTGDKAGWCGVLSVIMFVLTVIILFQTASVGGIGK